MLRIFSARFKPIAAVLISCGLSFAVAAEDGLGARAQGVLDRAVAEAGLPALSAGIARDGKIVWVGAAGFMDVENKVAANPDMVHRLASVSKPMTAVAAMQLVEQGKFDLEAPVRKYVASWPEKPEGEILIRHVLSHTSGMRHYLGVENRPMSHYATLLDAMNLFKDRPLAFAPGDQYLYTTYGYTLLGACIESASGEKYADYMREHVWGPAGMEHTNLEVKGLDTPNKAKLYRRSASGPVADADDDASVRYPGGGIQSTAADLLRFGLALENHALLSKASMDRMQVVPPLGTPPAGGKRTPYALGWMVFDSKDYGRIVTHDGGQSGTSTNFSIYPDHGVVVAVLCNVQDASKPVVDVTIALARLAIGLPERTPGAAAAN